jgi:hypothetical protein
MSSSGGASHVKGQEVETLQQERLRPETGACHIDHHILKKN